MVKTLQIPLMTKPVQLLENLRARGQWLGGNDHPGDGQTPRIVTNTITDQHLELINNSDYKCYH